MAKEELKIPDVVIVARVSLIVAKNIKPSADSKVLKCYHCKELVYVDALGRYYSENGSIILCLECEKEVGSDFEELEDILVPVD